MSPRPPLGGLVADKSSQLLKGTVSSDTGCLAHPRAPRFQCCLFVFAVRRLGIFKTKLRNPLHKIMPATLRSGVRGVVAEYTNIVGLFTFVVIVMVDFGLRTFVPHHLACQWKLMSSETIPVHKIFAGTEIAVPVRCPYTARATVSCTLPRM